MDDTDQPIKISLPWGAFAGAGYITVVPVPSQIGVSNGRASWTDGFPPLNFVPDSAGGVPPFGDDFNGALHQISAYLQWLQAGGPQPFDSAFATAIGGYPKNALIADATVNGLFWCSTVDNNVTDPAAGSANWFAFTIPGVLASNVLFQTFYTTGTYTIPSGAIKITAVGPGGGGAGTNSGVVPQPAGGGAGATLIKYLSGLTPGRTLAVTLGTRGAGGGTANVSGSAGTATTVASGTQTISTLTAGAGQGGPAGASTVGGAGGVATGGNINMLGSGGNGAPSGIGGVAQPYAPYGEGGSVALNTAVFTDPPLTIADQDGAPGIVTIEAVG